MSIICLGRSPLDSSIHAQAAHGERGEKVYHMPHIFRDLQWATAQEPTHPALRCRPVSCHVPRNRIESFPFAFSLRIILHIVSHRKERRKRVRQIQQRRGGNDTDEAEIIWNRCRDDKGDGPPDGHNGGVEDFAAAGDERRCIEEVHEDVIVENFDTDVAIQSSSDEGGNEGNHVSDCLPAVD